MRLFLLVDIPTFCGLVLDALYPMSLYVSLLMISWPLLKAERMASALRLDHPPDELFLEVGVGIWGLGFGVWELGIGVGGYGFWV